MPVSALSPSLMPKINAGEWKKLAAAAEDAEKVLRKDKTDAKAKKVLKTYEDGIDTLEALLAKVVDTVDSKLTEVVAALKEVAKLSPMPDAISQPLKKQLGIAATGRAADVKDLRKEQKEKMLRSNPAKLIRVISDVNDDVAAANVLANAVDAAVDDMMEAEIKQLKSRIESALPKPVTGATILLDHHIKTFTEANRKKRWANFPAACKAFATARAEDGAEALRAALINAMNREPAFATLDVRKRGKIIEDAIKAGSTALAARQALRDALDQQHKPSKSAWVQHLGMTGYSIKNAGRFEGLPIHITFDKNSWTADAEKGVDVSALSVDQIFTALFDVDWTYQMHGTLELATSGGKYPHVYVFGNTNHWDKIKTDHAKTDAWITKAKAAVKSELDAFVKTAKAGIKTAKDKDGAI